MTGVSTATEQALESALDRLLSGQPLRTDGALTIAGLAREADVSRATANRATRTLKRLRAATATSENHNGTNPESLRQRIRTLEKELAARMRRENGEVAALRQRAHILAQHVQALALDNEALRKTLADHDLLHRLPHAQFDDLAHD
ncbi:hypothetical protein [Rhodococcus opacus]|uniref:hypothetical protein n=1 Tax=Rhodococcus opacus TaxID=37919 RepID=UPI0024BA6839|nr:hypothetical protein [Rhodococcus opacus]MDJ0418863.1 hypothetical protein [Rhodococcus opacus]